MRNNKRMSEPVISELAAQQDNEVVGKEIMKTIKKEKF
jgi:hypothetical protein